MNRCFYLEMCSTYFTSFNSSREKLQTGSVIRNAARVPLKLLNAFPAAREIKRLPMRRMCNIGAHTRRQCSSERQNGR